jgi:hypothetical protein
MKIKCNSGGRKYIGTDKDLFLPVFVSNAPELQTGAL